MSWQLFAFIAMVVFSFSNLALKVVSEKYDLAQYLSPLAIPAALGGIVFLLATAYSFNQESVKIPTELLLLGAVIVILSALGVGAFLLSLKTGKVAVITAILSISTVVVAALSILLTGTQFSSKEIAAMLLAVVSVLALVL